jgi:hypothetical protein
MAIQYGACALHARLVRLHVRKHMPEPYTHTQKQIRLIAFPRPQRSRERA